MRRLDSAGLDLDEGFVAEIGIRASSPENERPLHQRLASGRISRQRTSREIDEAIELVHIDLVGFNMEDVTGWRGRDQRALVGALSGCSELRSFET